ncbi:MAG: aldehyde dehydrogenase (NADP(+)), partial [Planctomycetes bacterium]|nr:aldehyde dehydrogenase (NADP(+)) [Planctomycetota bacterium]
MTTQPILIDGQWREANASGSFQADDPALGEQLPDRYPVSGWGDCDAALDAAAAAFQVMRTLPAEQIAEFLDHCAGEIERRRDALVQMAHRETGLPVSPRLADAELPRTTDQLRQAATAAREGSWALPTIDTAAGIRSCFEPIGPVCVFGPNNFPFAFGSISGGDFAAAVAAGNPVIAKANSSHPGTTRIFAEAAEQARRSSGLPAGAVQLLYRTSHADGERLVADSRTGATAYTGSRSAGLKLKAAADAAGKPIYLELSSVNPVVILPGAIEERGDAIAGEFTTSCLMGTGQFCTNPGLVVMLAGDATERFIQTLCERFAAAPVGTLLSKAVQSSLQASMDVLAKAGAQILIGGTVGGGRGYCHANTLTRVSGERFLADPETLQTEAFGNASLLVVADDLKQMCSVLERIEGNLTGCIYSDSSGSDDEFYDRVANRLRPRVGRLLNDKMPTGVAVSPAMNHGGPYPATGHPGFTAVGIPASLRRFAMLACYDNVRPGRLPSRLRDKNPNGSMWRCIDGQWTQQDVPRA